MNKRSKRHRRKRHKTSRKNAFMAMKEWVSAMKVGKHKIVIHEFDKVKRRYLPI